MSEEAKKMSDEFKRHLLSCHQRLLFGAPGTGKSHQLDEEVKKLFGERYERVTFYPTYSYAQFVGCYKPVMKGEAAGEVKKTKAGSASNISIESLAQKLIDAYNKAPEKQKTGAVVLFAMQYTDALQGKGVASRVVEEVEKAGLPRTTCQSLLSAGRGAASLKARQDKARQDEEISYAFVPGPFLRVLVKALNNPGYNHCLVIEEVNRANAAAVFGDVFQLLDRDDDAASKYDIAASEDIQRFLEKSENAGGLSEAGKQQLKRIAGGNGMDRLKIPSNMYIWATMNSADQGVFPMDTAFKRRWEFEYIGINQGVTPECKTWTIDGTAFKWNDFRVFANGLLSLHGVNEDKLMGPWFVKVKREKDSTVSAKQFQSKVLMYLWEDAARMCRKKVFLDDITTFSQLVAKWNGRVSSVFKCNEENKKYLEKLLAAESRETPAPLAPMDGPPEGSEPEGSGQ